MEVALRPDNSFIKALRKWSEIQNFDDKNHSHLVNGNKASEHQDNVLRQELEDRLRNIADLKRKTDDLTEKKDNLKKEKDELSKKVEEEEIRLDSLEKAVGENTMNQDKEIQEFKDSCDRNIKELGDYLMRELEKTEQNHKKKISLEINELNKRCNRENETKDCERRVSFHDVKRCLSYIAAVCLNLQSNMYLYVLPDQYAGDCPYKVKDIEEDIDDEDLLNEEQREEASEKWEELKKELQWEESLKGTLKMLQNERNSWDVPGRLEVEEAEKAAEELNKQGRLKGRASYQRVQKILQMWEKSVSLVSHYRE